MKNGHLKILLIFLILIFQSQKVLSNDTQEVNIIAKINNEIITNVDVDVEVRYLEALSPSIKNLSKNERLLIAKKSLIKEKIKENELIKYIKIEEQRDALFKETMQNFYKKLGLENDSDFRAYLAEYELSIKDIEHKILIETSWNSLIYQKYNDQVEVNKEALKSKIKRYISNNKIQNKYLLSEILFSADSKDLLNSKYKLITESLKNVGFKNTATIYSESNTKNFGGLIGWITEDKLSRDLSITVDKLKIDEVSNPINVPGGMLLISFSEKKSEEINYNIDNELKKLISFEENKQLRQFSSIYYNKIKKNTYITNDS